MADLTPLERLQPALLDRLTDNAPEKQQESREERVMGKNRFRQAVLRDLAWLFNSTRLEAGRDLSRWPHVQRSVLNYGVVSLTGKTASNLRTSDLERLLTKSIERFEPRIIARTLKVRVAAGEMSGRPNTLVLTIEGDLWGDPFPEALFIRTQLDLETGNVTVEEHS